METTRKIIVKTSEDLFQKEPQMRRKDIVSRDVYEKLRQLRGKIKFSLNIKKLREDRE